MIIITLIKIQNTHYLLYGNRMVLPLNKLGSLSPKVSLCQVWLKLAKRFCRRRVLYFVNVFLLFRTYLSLEKDGALHLNKLEFNPLIPKILREEYFFPLNLLLLYSYFLPFEMDMTLHLNTLAFI